MFKKILIYSLFLVFLASSVSFTAHKPLVKQPNVSGIFYPASEMELMDMVDNFLDKAKVKPIDGKIVALISPHAGYEYSGQVAAYAYNAIRHENFDTVIILGPSHYFSFGGFSTYPKGYFETPLGRLKVDEDLVKKLTLKFPRLLLNRDFFKKEHSLEVQLPFLQRTLFDCEIVPIITGELSYEDCEDLARTIVSSIKKKRVLVVASTDLSHYYTMIKSEALDKKTIKAIKSMDARRVFDEAMEGKIELCGLQAVVTTMLVAEKLKADRVELLNYANSGRVVSFDTTKVVGYASLAFIKSGAEENNETGEVEKNGKKREAKGMLNEPQRKQLLDIARASIAFYMENKKPASFVISDNVLKKKKGVFVTLKINGQLRGCIGHIAADVPLYEAVSKMAVEAAFRDPRFKELSREELAQMEIEISVLSPLEKIEDLDEIEVGKHGLFIRKGSMSGLLLPQVATEYGWDEQEFLENLCYKAGMNKDAYRECADIYIFTAEVFGED